MYKVLIIGFGSIAHGYNTNSKLSITHYNAIKKSRNFKLVAIVDKKRINLKNYPYYKDYNTAIKIHKPDLIVLSVPTSSHYKILKKLTQYDKVKIILCEKPFTENFLQSKKIKKLYKNLKVKIFINYMRNVDYILEDKINNYFQVKKNNSFTSGFVFYNGTPLNSASHYISLLIKYFGKVINIKYLENKKNSFILNFKKAKFIFFSNKQLFNLYERLQIFNAEYFLSYNNGGESLEIRRLAINPIYKKKIFFKTMALQKNKFYKNCQEYVYKELYKYLKKKKCSLPSTDNGINVHKIINFLKHG
jgi:hypothetical protein